MSGHEQTGVSADDFLGYTVVRLGHVLQQHFEAALAPVGLTARGFGVLSHLAASPGLGSGELARLVMVTPQSMGQLLDDLESQGLLVRAPATRGRRRSTRVTEEGVRRLAAAAPAVLALDGRLAETLGRSRAREVNGDLHRLLAAQQS